LYIVHSNDKFWVRKLFSVKQRYLLRIQLHQMTILFHTCSIIFSANTEGLLGPITNINIFYMFHNIACFNINIPNVTEVPQIRFFLEYLLVSEMTNCIHSLVRKYLESLHQQIQYFQKYTTE